MGVTAGQKVITVDIVEAGKTMAACRVLGMLPEWIEPGENYGLHVHTYQGLTSIDLAEGGCIVERRGFAKTMQALADHYGATVVVACDPGVGNAVTAKMVGTWEPGAAKTAMAAASNAADALANAQQSLGNAEVLGNAMADVLAEPASSTELPAAELVKRLTGEYDDCGNPKPHTACGTYGCSGRKGQPSPTEVNADSFLADAFANLPVLNKMWSCTLCGDRFATGAESIAHQCAPRGWDNSGPSVAGHPCDICCEPVCDGHQVERWVSVPASMRPARKNRVSRRGKTTRRQRARNRG